MSDPASEYYAFQGNCRRLETEGDVVSAMQKAASSYSRVFSKFLPSEKKAPIYEAACGPGILLRWLKVQGYENIEASDLADKEASLARAGGFDVKTRNAIEELERFSGKFWVIFALDFIEHLPREEALRFLRAANAALRPGGHLILRMPNGDSPFVGRNLYNDITHHWAYTTTAFRAVARICGFAKVSYRDDTLVSIAHRRALKLPVMWLAQSVVKALFRAATHADFRYLGSSIYVFACKGEDGPRNDS